MRNSKYFRALRSQIPFAILGLLIAIAISFAFRNLQVSVPNTLNPEYLRYDSKALNIFFKEIKDKNGILVLGTSETASGEVGLRYWEIGDFNGRPVYALSGAGRSSYTSLLSGKNYT